MLQPNDLIKLAMGEEPVQEEQHSTARKVHDAVVTGATAAVGAVPAAIAGINSLDNTAKPKVIV